MMPRFRAWVVATNEMYHVTEMKFLPFNNIKDQESKNFMGGAITLLCIENSKEYRYIQPKFVDLMLYSGIPDIDHKEICEGDIVEIELEGDKTICRQIFYEDGCFWFDDWNTNGILPVCDYNTEMRIVGNTYEHDHYID